MADDHPITTVVTRDVMAGREAEYEEWARDAASRRASMSSDSTRRARRRRWRIDRRSDCSPPCSEGVSEQPACEAGLPRKSHALRVRLAARPGGMSVIERALVEASL
jgi:hypothetical protein